MGLGALTPVYKLVAQGADITAVIEKRLLQLTVTDNAGIEADSVEIMLDDGNHHISSPTTGAMLEVSLGYRQTALRSMGRYTVDEVEYCGPPNKVTLRARAADLTKSLKKRKTRTWTRPGTTPPPIPLPEIVAIIAADNGLIPKIGQQFSAMQFAVLNQSNESDLHFLTRIAKDIGAIVKPASGYLLFVSATAGISASGAPLPTISLRPNHVVGVGKGTRRLWHRARPLS